MSDTITLQDAAKMLGYKKISSVERWCAKNDVKICSGFGSNKKYLIRMQFEYAQLRKFIQYLKAKHKGKWLNAFKVYMSMNIISVVEMEERGKIGSIIGKVTYQPIGEHEEEFLSRLTNNTSEQ